MAKNKWQLHVEATKKKYPNKPLSEVLVLAKKTYKK